MKIKKYLRHKIGALLSSDPAKEKVIVALLERLKDHSQWVKGSNRITIVHKEFNISVDIYDINEPRSVRIPFKWKADIKEHIQIVMRNHDLENLNFAHDVICGKYAYQHRYTHQYTEVTEWLNENANSSQYIIDNGWIYISDESLAVGFKLKFG